MPSTTANEICQHLIRAAQILFIVLLFAAPLPFGSVQAGWIFFVQAGVIFLFVLWLASQLVEGSITFAQARLALPLALLVIYLGLTLLSLPSSVLRFISSEGFRLAGLAAETVAATGKTVEPAFRISLTPFESEGELLKLVAYALAFFITINVFRHRPAFLRLYRALIASGTFIGLFGIIQNVWSNGKIYWRFESGSGTPFGPFVNHNHFAGYVELCLGLSMGMCIAEWLRFHKRAQESGMAAHFAWAWLPEGGRVWLFLVTSFIMIAALTLSLSRGGVISFLATSLIFGTAALVGKRKALDSAESRHFRLRPLLIFAGLITIIVVVGILANTPRVRQRLRLDEAAAYRVRIWESSLKAISDFPLTGAGLGSFRILFPRYKSGMAGSEVTHAENEYIQWLVETGFLGTMLILFVAGRFLRILYLRLRNSGDYESRYLALGAAFGITSLSIHNCMDFNLHIPSNALTFVVIGALCILLASCSGSRAGRSLTLETTRIRPGRAGSLSLTVLVLILGGWFGYRCFSQFQSTRLEQLWSKHRQAAMAETSSRRSGLQLLPLSLRWAPLNARAHFLLALEYESEALEAGFFQFERRHTSLDKAETEILEALVQQPISGTSWSTLGRIEALRQNARLSERAFQLALSLAGTDGLIHRDYGLALLSRGDTESAVSSLSLARTYNPEMSLRNLLELLASRTSNRSVWERLVKNTPSDLKTYAGFLTDRGLTEMGERVRAQADALERTP